MRDEEITLLPNCTNEEQALLGSIFIDPFAIDQVRGLGVENKDFYLTRNKLVFEAMCALWDSGQPIDPVLVADELKIARKLEEVGGQSYLFDLTAATPTHLHAAGYAQKVLRYSLLRKYITLAGNITRKAYDGTEPDELFAHIQETMHTMQTGTDNDSALMTWQESFDYSQRLMQYYDERDEEDVKGWTWRWPSWNRLIDPIEPGMLAVIAAADGSGKTSFAECLADWWAIQGKKVVFVHFELNRRVMIGRRLARHAHLTMREIKANDKTPMQRQQIAEAEARIQKWTGAINYLHTPGWSIERTVKELKHLHSIGECDVVILDYLEKASASTGQVARRMNETSQEADNVSQLKDFAEEKEVRLVMLSQLNKAGKQKAADDLDRMDGRGAGQKSEFSNIYVILHRAKLKEGMKDLTGKYIIEPGGYDKNVTVRVDKNTLGPTGSFAQYIDAAHFDVYDVEET